MTRCLLAVDLFSDFAHEDGERLLSSFRERRDGIVGAVCGARERSLPIVYANDTYGIWDGDAGAVVRRALEGPASGDLRRLAPRDGDSFVIKPRYSAFDLTPLELVLDQLGVRHVLLMGMVTEMCVAQTAIEARQRELEVTVVTDACATVDERNEETALRYLEAVTGTKLAATFADAT